MSNFHNDAVKFMVDLLKLLDQQATTSQLGSSSSGKESIFSVILRLIGVTETPNLQVNNDSKNTSTIPAPATPNLVDSFFKIQTRSNELQLAQINSLLKTFRKRLTRYSHARQQIKLNRTKRLIDAPTKPLVSTDLIKDDPTQTRKALGAEQAKLQQSGDLTGIVDQDLNIQEALELSINDVVNIPDNTGEFRNQLVGFLRATAKEASDNVDKLILYKTELQSEVNRLQNAEKLLFDGVETFSGSDQKLSLMKVLDVLIFLTDRKQMKYNCAQCKFFREGKSNVCTFAGQGVTALTSLVTIVDQATGEAVVGRLAQPTNSCKEIWGLDSNDYYTPSDSVTEFLTNLLKE